MKRFGIAVLMAALCVLLSACGGEKEPVATTAPPVVLEAAKNKNKISVAREESFEYTDNNGNKYSTSYRIPSVNLDSEENLEKTLSESNLDKAMLYLGKDGRLTAICKEYASVGAGEFSVVLTLK